MCLCNTYDIWWTKWLLPKDILDFNKRKQTTNYCHKDMSLMFQKIVIITIIAIIIIPEH